MEMFYEYLCKLLIHFIEISQMKCHGINSGLLILVSLSFWNSEFITEQHLCN